MSAPKGETTQHYFLMLEQGASSSTLHHDLVHTDNKFVREFLE